MADTLENTIRQVAEKLAAALNDAQELSIETHYVEIDQDGTFDIESSSKPAAKTVIHFDGDYKVILPMRRAETSGSLTLDTELFELHMKNVQVALENRAKLLNSLFSLLPGRRG